MKKILFILLAAFTLASCSETEDIAPAKGTVSVELSKQAADVQLITRTVDDDLQVDILGADGSLVKHFAEGEAHSGLQALELAAGTYSLRAYTPNYNTVYTNDQPGEAKYYAETDIHVVAGRQQRVGLQVPMTNMAFTLSLPEGVGERFTNIRFTLTRGDRTRELADGETAYFDLTPSADLEYTLEMTNADGEVRSQEKYLKAADQRAGTHYTITYEMGRLGLR